MREELLAEVVEALEGRGLEDVEVYAKRGRSRRLEHGVGARAVGFAEEAGWAARAGDRRASFFATGSGPPRPDGPWPEPDGAPLRLPAPAGEEAAPWREPEGLDAPLLGERDGHALLDAVAEELAAEAPGARLLHGVLEDGTSETQLLSNRGIAARYRSRLASIYLEAAGPGAGGERACLHLAEREARRFAPRALARRLADRLLLAHHGKAVERDRGEILLAPAVACHLLAGLLPLLVGPEAWRRVAPFQDARGRLGGEALTVRDDGRLPGGALTAPVDGEGLPTREVTLVAAGVFRQPLLAWWQADASAPRQGRASGCGRRPGWRDLPRPGPTHLYVEPRPRVSVASLLADVARGYYLIEATGPAVFDLAEDRFHLPVCGFAVRGGRASGSVAGVELAGAVGALLRGIQGAARDLTFLHAGGLGADGGMIGSPSLLVTGLELRRA